MKKVLIVFVVVVLFILMLVSCGNDGNQNNDDSQEVIAETTPTPTPEPEPDISAYSFYGIWYWDVGHGFSLIFNEDGTGEWIGFDTSFDWEVSPDFEYITFTSGDIIYTATIEGDYLLVHSIDAVIGEMVWTYTRVQIVELETPVPEGEVAFIYADYLDFKLPLGWQVGFDNVINMRNDGGAVIFSLTGRFDEGITDLSGYNRYRLVMTSSLMQLEAEDIIYIDVSSDAHYPTLSAVYHTMMFGRFATGISFAILGEENTLVVHTLNFANSGIETDEVIDFVFSIRFRN